MTRTRGARPTTLLIVLLPMIVSFCLDSPALARDEIVPQLTLNKSVADIAKAVFRVVDAQHTRELTVGLFNDNADPNHTFGIGLRDLFIKALRAEGLNPTASADIRFFGSFEIGPARISEALREFPVAKIAFTVARRNGIRLLDSEKDLALEQRPRVTDPGDLARMSGQTGFTPPSLPAGDRFKTFFESEKGNPNLFEIAGTLVRPKGAPYAVEMRVAKFAGSQKPNAAAFQPRAVEAPDGRPFLKVKPGEVNAGRIINDAGHEAAVTLSIDGLSMFAFRDDKNDKAEHVIVAPHSAADILGWYRNEKTSNVFQVVDLPPHPDAKLLKNPALIGAITVTFAACWEKDSQKPRDEPPTRQATEIQPGAPIDAPYETVKRFIGVRRAAVTVRYDKM